MSENMWKLGDKVQFWAENDPKYAKNASKPPKTYEVVNSYWVYGREEYGLYPTELTVVRPLNESGDDETVEARDLEEAEMTDWVHATTNDWVKRVQEEMTMQVVPYEKGEKTVLLQWFSSEETAVHEGYVNLVRSTRYQEKWEWYMSIPTISLHNECVDGLDKAVTKFVYAIAKAEREHMQSKYQNELATAQAEDVMNKQIKMVRETLGITYIQNKDEQCQQE